MLAIMFRPSPGNAHWTLTPQCTISRAVPARLESEFFLRIVKAEEYECKLSSRPGGLLSSSASAFAHVYTGLNSFQRQQLVSRLGSQLSVTGLHSLLLGLCCFRAPGFPLYNQKRVPSSRSPPSPLPRPLAFPDHLLSRGPCSFSSYMVPCLKMGVSVLRCFARRRRTLPS